MLFLLEELKWGMPMGYVRLAGILSAAFVACSSLWAAEPTEAEAVVALEKLGAKVSRDEKKTGKPVDEVHFPRKGCDISDDDLKHLARLTDVERNPTAPHPLPTHCHGYHPTVSRFLIWR